MTGKDRFIFIVWTSGSVNEIVVTKLLWLTNLAHWASAELRFLVLIRCGTF